MKLHFNDHHATVIIQWFIPIALAFSLSSVMIGFMAHASVETPKLHVNSFYNIYRIGKDFGLRVESNATAFGMKKVTHEVFKEVPHRLSALYRDTKQGFAGIDDGSATTFVDFGKLYKNRYRLIEISSDHATLYAYGKKMRLKLGEEGSLSVKEMVTEYIPDRSQMAVAENVEISKATINRYTYNSKETWKNIKISEAKDGNQLIGYKIDRIEAQTPFAQLGLIAGDVIVSVDNKQIDSYASALWAYNSLLKNAALKITVMRNNQPKDLEYEISH